MFNKIFKILLILLISSIANADIQVNSPKEKSFAEIVLKDLLKDTLVNRINSLVEEVEATLDEKKLVEVGKLIEDCIEKEHENFLYYYFLARVHYSLVNLFNCVKGDKKRAERYLESSLKMCQKSIKLNKRFSDSYRLAGDIYGRLLEFKNPILYGYLYGSKAKRLVEKAIELDSQNPEGYLARGRNYFFAPPAFGGSKHKAIKDFEKAIELCPGYYMSYIWLGEAYFSRGEKEEAKKLFEKALQLEPRSNWVKYELLNKVK
ncbi:MAG: tetratricopeptide repeat protein [bacterium]|nr:tetratricopeptide repeat protein [bacterium]